MTNIMVEVRRSNGMVVVKVPVSSKYAAKKQARRLADSYGDSYEVSIVNETMKGMGNGATKAETS